MLLILEILTKGGCMGGLKCLLRFKLGETEAFCSCFMKRVKLVRPCIILLALLPIQSNPQWLNPESIQNTVLIEKKGGSNGLLPHGTGFLLYNYKNPANKIVVTCAHLIKNKNEIFVRMNIDSTVKQNLKTNKVPNLYSEKENWFISDDNLILRVKLTPQIFTMDTLLDIGAFFINIPVMVIRKDSLPEAKKVADKLSIPKSMIKYRKEIKLGDEVYFIGFPFGIGTDNIITPIVRSGSISWVPQNSDEFLIDAFSYSGNSGSPIFCKILMGTNIGKISWSEPKLVGMIIGHRGISLNDVLTQPDPNVLKFEKGSIEMNFGLARCVYMDDILRVVEQLLVNEK